MAPQHDLTTSNGVHDYLETHGYPTCLSVERLAEGWSGFVYRARLSGDTEPSSVIVKHVEGYAARWPDFKIGQGRMDYEAKGLKFLRSLLLDSTMPHVQVPRLLEYDSDNHVLIMQDVGKLPTLKSWLRADSPREHVRSIGQDLGSFLAHVHNTTAHDSILKGSFASNDPGKHTSSSAYFAALPPAAEKSGYTQPLIAAAGQFAAAEVLTANEVWTLGDFWTGNVLVSAPSEQSKPVLTVLDLELAKPGTAAFDVGHMAAEMLCLARFRYQDQGTLLLRTFFQAYKAERKVFGDTAAVAIRIGAHLFTMVPRPWIAEVGEVRVKEVMEEGFQLLKMGWEKDELALKYSVVGVLME